MLKDCTTVRLQFRVFAPVFACVRISEVHERILVSQREAAQRESLRWQLLHQLRRTERARLQARQRSQDERVAREQQQCLAQDVQQLLEVHRQLLRGYVGEAKAWRF